MTVTYRDIREIAQGLAEGEGNAVQITPNEVKAFVDRWKTGDRMPATEAENYISAAIDFFFTRGEVV